LDAAAKLLAELSPEVRAELIRLIAGNGTAGGAS
jgi:hypothetical protein